MALTAASHQIPLHFNSDDDSNNTDMDPSLNLMLDLDDIFSEVVASFDPVIPVEEKLLVAASVDEAPATMALGAFPFAPSATPSQYGYIPVTPNTSSDALSSYAEPPTIVDPSKIAEISIACVSPSPSSSAEVLIAPKATPSSATKSKVAIKAKKNATKKRKYSSTATTSTVAASITTDAPVGLEGVDEKIIEEQRRQRNRDHARKSRQRKKSLTGSLQSSLEELKVENAKLREQIYAIIGQKKAEQMVDTKLTARHLRFVEVLKQPQNRVVDTKTLNFLKGLRTKVVSAKSPTATTMDEPMQFMA